MKVEYSGGYSVIAPRVFARHAEGRVANPQDCVIFFKSKGFAGGPTQGSVAGGGGVKKKAKSKAGTQIGEEVGDEDDNDDDFHQLGH